MAKPSVHVTKNGVEKKFWGGKAGRKCPPKVQHAVRKCAKCGSDFIPSRKWNFYCGVRCRGKVKVLLAISKEPPIERKSRHGSPFGKVVCPTCGIEFVSTRSTKKYCGHRCFRLRLQRNWINKNRAKGLCYSCAEKPVTGTVSYCRQHWIAQAAWRAGLRGKGQWIALEELLKRQGGKCPYTGRVLVLGVNASVDHKKPRSLFPSLIGDIENLEWVDVEVNRAKRAMAKDEFIALCKLIAERHQ